MKFLLLALLAVSVAHARRADPLPPILFGPEFTFAIEGTPYKTPFPAIAALATRMRQHLIDGQPAGAKFLETQPERFVSPNGWSFVVAPDGGVVEIKMPPLTAEQIQRFSSDIQDAIFVSAANVGLFPGLFVGGGHMNIDLRALAQRPLLLRNFIVDLFNHSELFMGVFSYDTNNALPYALFSGPVKQAVHDLIAKFDGGGVEAVTLLKDLNDIQHSSSDPFTPLWHPNTPLKARRYKYTALSLVHIGPFIGETSRLELRGLRPQASYHVWARQTELLQKRLEYLNALAYPIPLEPQVHLVSPIVATFAKHGLNPPVRAQEALAAFHRYVSESGLRWADHREYLWPAWLSAGEVSRYEQSETFRHIEAKACRRSLQVGNL